jgi:hypothetical protein
MASDIDLWAGFLKHEKLDPKQMSPDWVLKLIGLCEELAKKGKPKYRPYAARIQTRELIVNTAMDMAIDLVNIRNKFKGRYIIGRGLLDVWNRIYEKRFGSIHGTRGELVNIHRQIVSKGNHVQNSSG